MRVLLVEDEHKISAYVRRGLEESGYAVDAVFTGKDALDWAEAASYDLIILDIMIPVVDGLTVCRELRQRHRLGAPLERAAFGRPRCASSAASASIFWGSAGVAGGSLPLIRTISAMASLYAFRSLLQP